MKKGRNRYAENDELHAPSRVIHCHPDEECCNSGPDSMLESIDEDPLGKTQHCDDSLAVGLRLIDVHDVLDGIAGLLAHAERKASYGPQEHPHSDIEFRRPEFS